MEEERNTVHNRVWLKEERKKIKVLVFLFSWVDGKGGLGEEK